MKRDNFILNTTSIGDVELRHLTVGDSIEMSHLLAMQGIDDREFVLRVIHRQLVTPRQTITEFRNIAEDDLQDIAGALVANEDHSFEYYADTGHLYADIRAALKEYQLRHIEAFRSMALRQMDHLARQVKAITGDSDKRWAMAAMNLVVPRVNMMTLLPTLELAKKQLQAFDNQFATIAQHSLESHQNVIQNALKSVPGFQGEVTRIRVEALTPYLHMADHLASMARIAMDHMKPQIEMFQSWVAKNQRIFDPIWKSWDEINKENKIQETQAAKILRRYKWFICPSMPVSAIRAILSVAKKKGRKDADINRLFLAYFAHDNWKNLDSMAAAWSTNPLFKTRMPIVKNCVKTLQAADKNGSNGAIVVLPTLVSQIDGILTDYLVKKGIPFETMYGDQVRRGKVQKVGRKTQFKANVPKVLTDELNDLAMDMFLNVLFQSSQRGTPLATPFNFNRHKIMHGETVRFGRKDYVVRAFMVLDFLAHLK